jgi:hypothetical protein
MLEITHRPSGSSWVFNCAQTRLIQGGGHTLDESVDCADHAVRQYLSRGGYEVTLADARHRVTHTTGW